jgi:group I intron endonuclease
MSDVSGVYLLEFSNGSIYVGSSRHVRRRTLRHFRDLEGKRHSNPLMQNVFGKYGLPMARLLLRCREADLLLYEQLVLDAMGPVLNLSPTAGRNLGHKHDAATRERMRAAAIEGWAKRPRVVGAEQRQRISIAMAKRTLSPETRAKISAAKKGWSMSEAAREKIRAAKLGRPRRVYAGKPWPHIV